MRINIIFDTKLKRRFEVFVEDSRKDHANTGDDEPAPAW